MHFALRARLLTCVVLSLLPASSSATSLAPHELAAVQGNTLQRFDLTTLMAATVHTDAFWTSVGAIAIEPSGSLLAVQGNTLQRFDLDTLMASTVHTDAFWTSVGGIAIESSGDLLAVQGNTLQRFDLDTLMASTVHTDAFWTSIESIAIPVEEPGASLPVPTLGPWSAAFLAVCLLAALRR